MWWGGVVRTLQVYLYGAGGLPLAVQDDCADAVSTLLDVAQLNAAQLNAVWSLSTPDTAADLTSPACQHGIISTDV